MTQGNETLQKRGGSNEPDRARERNIVSDIRGRSRSVLLNMNGPDIELVPRPSPSNRGRCVVVLDAAGLYVTLGAIAVEEGSTLSGDIFFIDENNDEFEIYNVGATPGFLQEPSLSGSPPGNFFCLQHNEKIVFRPSAPDPNQKGLFLPVYHDTDAIGLRVPVPTASEVIVVQAPPGKFVGFPSAKSTEFLVAPFAAVGGAGVTATGMEFYLEDAEGNRAQILTLGVSENHISIENFEAVLTLAPGEKVIAKPNQAPGGNLTIHTTIALLNAANEAR